MDPGGTSARAGWAAPEGIEHFDLDSYPIAYRQAGAGDPLLLIHGSMNDYRAWTLQMAAFGAKYRTVAVSLRHSYPEAWNGEGEYTVASHAADIARFVDGMGLRPAHVVGHSRGGAVAILLAQRHPELVRSLVLAEPAGLEGFLPDTPEGRRMATESAAMFARLARDLATGDRVAAARNFVDALGGPGAWDRRAPDARQILLDNITTGPACAERPQFTARDIAELRHPAMLLTGERSPPRYRTMMTAMQGCNPLILPLVTLPDAAHAMQRDNPDAFNAAVMSFLAAQGPRV